jgi:hypothetical protein
MRTFISAALSTWPNKRPTRRAKPGPPLPRPRARAARPRRRNSR